MNKTISIRDINALEGYLNKLSYEAISRSPIDGLSEDQKFACATSAKLFAYYGFDRQPVFNTPDLHKTYHAVYNELTKDLPANQFKALKECNYAIKQFIEKYNTDHAVLFNKTILEMSGYEAQKFIRQVIADL